LQCMTVCVFAVCFVGALAFYLNEIFVNTVTTNKDIVNSPCVLCTFIFFTCIDHRREKFEGKFAPWLSTT
jgi:hypothetical protein